MLRLEKVEYKWKGKDGQEEGNRRYGIGRNMLHFLPKKENVVHFWKCFPPFTNQTKENEKKNPPTKHSLLWNQGSPLWELSDRTWVSSRGGLSSHQ